MEETQPKTNANDAKTNSCNRSEIPNGINNYNDISYHEDPEQHIQMEQPEEEAGQAELKKGNLTKSYDNNKDNPLKRKWDNSEEDTQATKKSKKNSDETPETNYELKIADTDVRGYSESIDQTDYKETITSDDHVETTHYENLSDTDRDVTVQDSKTEDKSLMVREQENRSPKDDIIQREIYLQISDSEKGVSKQAIQAEDNSSMVQKDQKNSFLEDDTSQLETVTDIIYKRQEELRSPDRSVNEQDSQAEDNSLTVPVQEIQESSSSEDDTNQSKPAPEVIYKRPEAKTFPKLYRLLGDHEDISCGLTAKDPQSYLSVAKHVAEGSNGSKSRYISTCSNLCYAQTLRSLKSRRRRFRHSTKQIVAIDVNELPISVRIIDLTTSELRRRHELSGQEHKIINLTDMRMPTVKFCWKAPFHHHVLQKFNNGTFF